MTQMPNLNCAQKNQKVNSFKLLTLIPPLVIGQRMAYRRIIFDLDGTLIDSARLTAPILDQMLASRDVSGGADRASELEEFRSIHRTIAVPEDLPFAGVRETLGALDSAGVGMAICSNKPQFLCEKILGDLGLARHFRAIIGSAPDRPRKPAPDTAFLALAALGESKASTLYCGDSAIDVATARAAGLDAALVAWGYGTHEALTTRPQTPVLKSMSDLRDAVLQHRSLSLGGG